MASGRADAQAKDAMVVPHALALAAGAAAEVEGMTDTDRRIAAVRAAVKRSADQVEAVAIAEGWQSARSESKTAAAPAPAVQKTAAAPVQAAPKAVDSKPKVPAAKNFKHN